MSWLKATLVRVVRTGAQAALATIGAAAVFSEVKWDVVGGATALAMLIAFLMALAGLPETPQESPVQQAIHKDHGQSVLMVVLIAAAVCLALLLILNVVRIN